MSEEWVRVRRGSKAWDATERGVCPSCGGDLDMTDIDSQPDSVNGYRGTVDTVECLGCGGHVEDRFAFVERRFYPGG